MQSVSSKILTRVAVSISYDDNHYTTGIIMINIYIYIYIYKLAVVFEEDFTLSTHISWTKTKLPNYKEASLYSEFKWYSNITGHVI